MTYEENAMDRFRRDQHNVKREERITELEAQLAAAGTYAEARLSVLRRLMDVLDRMDREDVNTKEYEQARSAARKVIKAATALAKNPNPAGQIVRCPPGGNTPESGTETATPTPGPVGLGPVRKCNRCAFEFVCAEDGERWCPACQSFDTRETRHEIRTAPVDCREAGPGKGLCDMCAAGRFENCRYARHAEGTGLADGMEAAAKVLDAVQESQAPATTKENFARAARSIREAAARPAKSQGLNSADAAAIFKGARAALVRYGAPTNEPYLEVLDMAAQRCLSQGDGNA